MSVGEQRSWKLRARMDGFPHGWPYFKPYDAEERARSAVEELFQRYVYPALDQLREDFPLTQMEDKAVAGEDRDSVGVVPS